MKNKDIIYGAILKDKRWFICRDLKEINKTKDENAIISDSLSEITEKISSSETYPYLYKELHCEYQTEYSPPGSEQKVFYYPRIISQNISGGHPVYSFKPDATKEQIQETLKTKPKDILIRLPLYHYNEEINPRNKLLVEQLTNRTYCPDIPGVIKGTFGLEYSLSKWKSRRYKHLTPQKKRSKKVINGTQLSGIYYRLINSFTKTGIPKLDKKDHSKGALYPFFDPYNQSKTSVSLRSNSGLCQRILILFHIMRRYGNRRLLDLTNQDIKNYLEEYKEHFIASNKTALYKNCQEFRIIRKYLIKFIYPYYESLKK